MDIEHMREYVELMRTRSFSEAASKFFLSRSALSKHISAIENEFRTPLVVRDKGGVEFTEAGKYVAREFERIIAIYDRAESHLAEMRSGISGSLSIGLSYYAVEKILLPVIADFQKSYPSIALKTASGAPDWLYGELLNDRVEVVSLNCDPDFESIYDEGIAIVPIYSEPCVLVCRSDHPFASMEEASISDLSGEKFIRCEGGEFTRRYNDKIIGWLGERGALFSEQMLIDNVDLLPTVVKNTHGVSLVPAHVAEHHVELVSVAVGAMPKVITALLYKKANDNPAIRLLIDVASRRRIR